MRFRSLVAHTCAAVILTGPLLAAPAFADTCIAQTDPTLGAVCALPGGLFQLEADRGTRLVVHGADAPVSEAPSDAVATDPSCVANPNAENHMVVIYAHPVDVASQYSSRLAPIRQLVREANGRLREEASEAGAVADYKVRCGSDGQVTVISEQLPTPSTVDSFNSVVNDLRALGYSQTYRKYWVWYEGSAGGASGTGHMYLDDSRSVNNANNAAPGTASTFAVQWGAVAGYSSRTWMHENAHNLGAVSDNAPDSSTYGHCVDGRDVMCYDDNSDPAVPRYSSTVCTDREHFDCGHDTYFNPDPPSGSWLDQNWNLAWVQNRFFRMRPTVGWDVADRSVSEAAGSLNLDFTRAGIAETSLQVRVQTASGSADASDFTPLDTTITVAGGQRSVSIPVEITADGVSEGSETFTVLLSTGPDAEVTLTTTTVTITDAALGPSVISSLTPDFTVREDAGVVQVMLERTGDTSQPASVTLTSSDRSAALTPPDTVSFATGDSLVSVPVTILDDSLGEPTREVTLALGSPDGATIGNPSLIRVTIEASDLQPDAMISDVISGGFLGNGTYNLTARGQRKLQQGRAYERRSYFVMVQNDGPETASFTLRRSATPSGTKLYAFDQLTGENLTWPLRRGYQIRLAPGQARKIKINTWVTASVRAGDRRSFWVSGNWAGDRWMADKVTGIIERR